MSHPHTLTVELLDFNTVLFELRYVDIHQLLAVKHNVVLSISNHPLNTFYRMKNYFAIKNFDDTADVPQFIKTQLQGSGVLHKCLLYRRKSRA